MGGKKDVSKMAKVAADREMRKRYGLLDMYTKENIDKI